MTSARAFFLHPIFVGSTLFGLATVLSALTFLRLPHDPLVALVLLSIAGVAAGFANSGST